MKLEKFTPSAALFPFVKEYLLIETDHATESRTIPGTSLVLSFRFRGNVKNTAGVTGNIPAASVSGLRKTARTFYYENSSANLLVILRECGMAAFSALPAHELFGQSISSDNIFKGSELRELLERMADARTHRGRVMLLENFLLGKLHSPKHLPLIGEAVRVIKQQNGLLKVKALADSLHISQDAFEKRFRSHTGATPKQFASIIRLKNLIDKFPTYSSLTDAAYEAGYFDQSHFIKDFKAFTGRTPKDFFSAGQFW
ncbi:AraC family transcriptional regulator [Chitinophaga sp. GCM10012297]|uniref:Helix-turn-helix transcriptional regulator n=1 Tax=Chitinophaga chungangae TaxID=2821488 RepID=A0ABS3YF83_9BACT|nr:helix-turn-helix transcriptional regulator [Chitinophaga chungangae]MBO9153344.1 helix-turn-helix transcriptional regulator [Chitinophaga chungangae]